MLPVEPVSEDGASKALEIMKKCGYKNLQAPAFAPGFFY
jgi:hypothetical protein